MNDDIWTPDEVAAYLKVERKYFMNRLAPRPDFPRPRRLGTGLHSLRRWKAEEVKDWLESRVA